MQFVINVLISSSKFIMISLSFFYLYQGYKFYCFSLGGILSVGAYTGIFINKYLQVSYKLSTFENILISSFVALIASISAGIIIDRLGFKKLRQNKSSSLVLMLASFGFLIITQNVISIICSSQVQFVTFKETQRIFELNNAYVTIVQITTIMLALIYIIFSLLFSKTKLGQALSAVSEDKTTASLIGINPEKVILGSVVIASVLAGLGGFLISMDAGIDPSTGLTLLFTGIVACIIGSIGNMKGCILGSIIIAIISNLSVLILPAYWTETIIFSVFLLFLLFKPYGILGKSLDRL